MLPITGSLTKQVAARRTPCGFCDNSK